MATRLRERVSYANVVATLALFVALGGSATAVITITGRDIKNRSIKRVDVGRNQLTGVEIRERRLKKVPRATRADLAAQADQAATAAQATTATTAGFAAAAGDASRLGGLDSGAFARATQIVSGSGDNRSTAQIVLIDLPDIGLQVRTDGDADDTNQLRLVNTGPNTMFFWSTGIPNSVGLLGPGANIEQVGTASTSLTHDVVFALRASPPDLQPRPVVSVTCRFSVPHTVACLAVRSL